jgi:hypothetical protein
MSLLTKSTAVILYGTCILPARILMTLLGRDPLQLRHDAKRASYWRPLEPGTDLHSYFSQGVAAERGGPRGMSGWLVPLYLAVARMCAPREQPQAVPQPAPGSNGVHKPTPRPAGTAVGGEGSIPDEIYTLW